MMVIPRAKVSDMAPPRPGDRIQIPGRLHTAGDDFAGGFCTVDGVYTPSIADAVMTRAGRVETPRVLKELARGGSASTWISVAEDPGSWFEWEGYLEPRQDSWRGGHDERPWRDPPPLPEMHTRAWLRPTPWAGAPADVALSEWQLRVTVRGRDYIDAPVSAIEDVGVHWDDLGTGFRIVIRGNTYRFWLLFPDAFGSRVPRWLRWAIPVGFGTGVLLAIGWPTLGATVLACTFVSLGAALWLSVHRARVERDAWLHALMPTPADSEAFRTAVAACDEADAQAQAGRVADAIEGYGAALRADPRSVRAHLGLGRAFARLGRLNDTAVSFRRAWALNPTLFERDLREHGGSFAFNVDALLERSLGESSDYGCVLDQGMAAVLEAGLRGGNDPVLDAAALLAEKRLEGDRAAHMVEEAARMADSLAVPDGWNAIQERMQRSNAGASAAAAAILVALREEKAQRPSGEALIGHAVRVAEWVYATGLEMSMRYPELARRLTGQSMIPIPGKGDVYAPVADMPGGVLYIVMSTGGTNAPPDEHLVVPLTFADHSSPFRVSCRFDGHDAYAMLDEMKTIRADLLERCVGKLDEESVANIEGGFRELFGN